MNIFSPFSLIASITQLKGFVVLLVVLMMAMFAFKETGNPDFNGYFNDGVYQLKLRNGKIEIVTRSTWLFQASIGQCIFFVVCFFAGNCMLYAANRFEPLPKDPIHWRFSNAALHGFVRLWCLFTVLGVAIWSWDIARVLVNM